MSIAEQPQSASDDIWKRYEDNFSRHVIGVSRYLQTLMMDSLQEQCGHRDLRLGFSPYITLVGENGRRLGELAAILGISRQACNQAIRQIERAGYLSRRADPADGRARNVLLTARGRKLRQDGARIVAQVDARFAAIAGAAAMEDAAATLGRLHRKLNLGPGASAAGGIVYSGLGGLLPRLSDYTLRRLMELTQRRGHPGLKLSHGQVLTLIGPGGGRIQQIAALQDVSKQAISAIATELETLHYLRRDTDPLDARQIVLHFTARGEELIADSVASVNELQSEFEAEVGVSALRRASATLRHLYRDLCLEQEVFEHSDTADIHQLASELRARLDDDARRALGRLLLNPVSELR